MRRVAVAAAAVVLVAALLPVAVSAQTEGDEPDEAVALEEFALDSANKEPRGVWSDGTTVWVSDLVGRLFAYTLSGDRDSAKDVTALAAAGNRHGNGMWSDGTTVWVSDRRDMNVYAYTLATGARDTDSEFALHADNAHAKGLWSDGTTMWVADWGDDALFAYTLADGTRAEDSDIVLHAGDPNDDADPANGRAAGIWSDGWTIWVLDDSALKIFAYDLATGARLADLDIGGLADAGNGHPKGVWSNGVTMWVTDKADDHVYAYALPTRVNSVTVVEPEDPENPDPEFEFGSEAPAVPTNLVLYSRFRSVAFEIDDPGAGVRADVRYKPVSAPDSDWQEKRDITWIGDVVGHLRPGVPYEVQARAWLESDPTVESDWSTSVTATPHANLVLDSAHSRPVGIGLNGETMWVGDRDSRTVRAYRFAFGLRDSRKDVTVPVGYRVNGVCATAHEVVVATVRDVVDEFDIDDDGNDTETYEDQELLYYSTVDGSRNSRDARGALETTDELSLIAPGALGCHSEPADLIANTQRSVLYYSTDPDNATDSFNSHHTGVLFVQEVSYAVVSDNRGGVRLQDDGLGTWVRLGTSLLWGGNDDPVGIAVFDSAAGAADESASGIPLLWVADGDGKAFAYSLDAPARRVAPFEFDLPSSLGEPAGMVADHHSVWVVDADDDDEIAGIAVPRPTGDPPVPLWAAVTPRSADHDHDGDRRVWVDFSHRLGARRSLASCFEVSWWPDGEIASRLATVLRPTAVTAGSYRGEDRRWGVEVAFGEEIPPGSAVRLEYTCTGGLFKRGDTAAAVEPFAIDVHSRPAPPPLLEWTVAGDGAQTRFAEVDNKLGMVPTRTTIWFHPRRLVSGQGSTVARPEVQLRQAEHEWSDTIFPTHPLDASNDWTFENMFEGREYRSRYRVWVGELASDWSPVSRITPFVLSGTRVFGVEVVLEPGGFAADAIGVQASEVTWTYVWIDDDDECDSGTSFPDSVDYTEGDAVAIATANVGRRLCFKATASLGTADRVSQTAPDRLAAPQEVDVDALPASATVSWLAPLHAADYGVDGYQVRWQRARGTSEWTTATVADSGAADDMRREHTFADVPFGTEPLRFQVAAVARGGALGPWTAPQTALRSLRVPVLDESDLSELEQSLPVVDMFLSGDSMLVYSSDGSMPQWDLRTGAATRIAFLGAQSLIEQGEQGGAMRAWRFRLGGHTFHAGQLHGGD